MEFGNQGRISAVEARYVGFTAFAAGPGTAHSRPSRNVLASIIVLLLRLRSSFPRSRAAALRGGRPARKRPWKGHLLYYTIMNATQIDLCPFCGRPDIEEYHFYPERDGETGGCRSTPLSEVSLDDYERPARSSVVGGGVALTTYPNLDAFFAFEFCG